MEEVVSLTRERDSLSRQLAYSTLSLQQLTASGLTRSPHYYYIYSLGKFSESILDRRNISQETLMCMVKQSTLA